MLSPQEQQSATTTATVVHLARVMEQEGSRGRGAKETAAKPQNSRAAAAYVPHVAVAAAAAAAELLLCL